MRIQYALGIAVLLSTASAKDLKEETVKAWDDYIGNVNARMEKPLTAGGPFLWTDELADSRQQLRAGKIMVAPVDQHVPKRVPSGLIHHWLGAAFIPNCSVEDVLSVTRNYERYSEYYVPTVVDAKPISKLLSEDRFSLLLMNKSVLLKTAMEGEYQSRYFQLDQERWYSVSIATRIQEIENYGRPTERKLPAGTGGGYLWRVVTFTRFEQRDGGVYIAVEAIVLSRDIPGAIRWFVEPVVRRLSKSSLDTSLRQTQDAVARTKSSPEVPASENSSLR